MYSVKICIHYSSKLIWFSKYLFLIDIDVLFQNSNCHMQYLIRDFDSSIDLFQLKKKSILQYQFYI